MVAPQRLERFNAIITPKNKDSGMLSRIVPIRTADEEVVLSLSSVEPVILLLTFALFFAFFLSANAANPNSSVVYIYKSLSQRPNRPNQKNPLLFYVNIV